MWSDIVWSDAEQEGIIFRDNISLTNGKLRKLKKLHFANRTNRLIWLPLKTVWNPVFTVRKEMLTQKGTNFLIFHSGVKFSPGYLRQLKRIAKVKTILYLPDTMAGLGIAYNREEWERYRRHYEIDKTFSFDPKDCEHYDLQFFDIYSSIPDCLALSHENPKCDLFYIGSCRSPERLDLIHKIYNKVTADGVCCDFRMTGVDRADMHEADGITYNQRLAYQDVVVQTLRSNCILEILNPGQHGNTLRYKEAVVYGRKLLTNNPNVLTSKYYDHRWMRYFEKVEDIDTQWLLSKERATYPYEGEYSPKNLIKMIIK